MEKLSVAVVACGFTGQQHVEAVRRIPGNEVIAIADPNGPALEEKAALLGIEAAYGDYKRMIDETKPDVVHNCTPNAMHYEVNRYCIERGIHVYCEKPLATTIAQGEELAALAQGAGVACAVNFNYRNNAMVQEMRQRVIAGETGRLFHVTGRYIQDWLQYDTDYNWRLESEVGGRSRAVADIGSHWFDTAQWAANRKITAVRASLLTVHPVRKKAVVQAETFGKSDMAGAVEVPIASEDAGFIQVRFEDGVMGQVLLSQVFAGHKNDLAVELAGERCSLEWRQESGDRLRIGSRENGMQMIQAAPDALHPEAARYATLPGGHPVAWSDALRNGIREYYRSIREGRVGQTGQCYATFADALQIMRLVEACLQSNDSGQWVEV